MTQAWVIRVLLQINILGLFSWTEEEIKKYPYARGTSIQT
jgi:hypothetical protein